jgi:hypothetical protein
MDSIDRELMDKMHESIQQTSSEGIAATMVLKVLLAMLPKPEKIVLRRNVLLLLADMETNAGNLGFEGGMSPHIPRETMAKIRRSVEALLKYVGDPLAEA